MAVIFQVRGTQLNAWVDQSGGHASQIKANAGTADSVVTADGNAGSFGGFVLSTAHTGTGIKALAYPGGTNWTSSIQFSVLMRVVPRFTGTPAAIANLFSANSADGVQRLGAAAYIGTNGKLGVFITDAYTAQTVAYTSTSALTFVSGTPTDIMFTFDGTTITGALKTSQDGVLLDSAAEASPVPAMDTNLCASITLAMIPGTGNGCNFDYNELVIFNNNQNPVYAVRTGFFASSAFDGSVNVFPAVSSVTTGVSFTAAGVPLVGTAPSGFLDNNPAVEQSI